MREGENIKINNVRESRGCRKTNIAKLRGGEYKNVIIKNIRMKEKNVKVVVFQLQNPQLFFPAKVISKK